MFCITNGPPPFFSFFFFSTPYEFLESEANIIVTYVFMNVLILSSFHKLLVRLRVILRLMSRILKLSRLRFAVCLYETRFHVRYELYRRRFACIAANVFPVVVIRYTDISPVTILACLSLIQTNKRVVCLL